MLLMRTEAEASEAINQMLENSTLWHLVDELTPGSTGLAAEISYMERLIRNLDDGSDKDQLRRIVDNWRRLKPATSLQPQRAHTLQELVGAVKTWDMRLGHERDSIPSFGTIFSERTSEQVDALASELGLKSADAIAGDFEIVAPIGGMLRANLARPATAAALIAEGNVRTERVIGLAGRRPMTVAELNLAATLEIPTRTEEDTLRLGLERAFQLDPSGWARVSGAGFLERHQASAGPDVFLSVAPVDDKGRRATTEQVVKAIVASRQLPQNASILQITTSIYRIANHIAFRTEVPRSMQVTTIGYREDLQPGPRQQFFPQHYLQELKAAIEQLPRLQEWTELGN
jgi:hypothetical protein